MSSLEVQAAAPQLVPSAMLNLMVAAEMQDNLLTASNDLDRLQRLLSDASESLLMHFYAANQRLGTLLHQGAAYPNLDTSALHDAMQNMAGAVTALQFQDMASQLIHHTNRRLRNCVDQLAREAMGPDPEGEAVVEQAPQQPNPVTQDEMDAGSVELF
ncbi:MAG: hypothetical protein RLZZ584_3191 [Pseudomonadota bacterium]|jgi:hypothetical protein